ncbi:PilZ domain-containing protein [Paenibacillus rhizovicinus]|uniref:PilZ domain-containing protein n=1 Tax=Paenibacillus rhizovicinus TaxID=2704463 RepID=A0A6C0NXB1_9BACL|nr:PilZ domain-containing protein [Paenibacillus rhizovicinus]QHW30818.1 PilZ domain-containing protein [Paenibacillus rhizovicinus]
MTGGTKAKNQDVYGSDKPKFSIKALLHSRTVIEKDGYVSTGVLTHAEGDMMEIELTEFKQFDLGDPVSLTIYSPVGTHRLRSSVIAKASGALAVLFPERSFAGLDERRESPRVDAVVQGTLKHKQSRTLMVQNEPTLVEVEETFELVTRNISDTGVAFQLPAGPKLSSGEIVDASLKLEAPFECQVEIIRKDESSEWTTYGARFLELNELQHRALRAFLIHKQVGAYFHLKQDKKSRQ